ncbi:hypothetical protein [Shewanella sp. CAL98-MNA-CIBAN-0140]|jgi:hypothetical protein|uniref:hypothetical protein n=1 Tax=unclassified Shewanella TaxID=196818 RepID=UPI0033263E17
MNSHHHQPLHYLPVRHYIRCGVVVTILTCTLALSAHVSANSQKNQPVIPATNMAATNISPIETITVIYRSMFDYALYEQTTEMLLSFNRDLSQSNAVNAQQQSRQMAAEFGVYSPQSITFNSNDKSLLSPWPLQSFYSNE